MDRNLVLEVSRLFSESTVSPNSYKLLENYCRYKGLEENKIPILMQALSSNMMLLAEALPITIEHYEKEYNICKVWDCRNVTKKLLLIY